MTNQAIAFPQGERRVHTSMSEDRMRVSQRFISNLKSRESKTKAQINEYLPEMISGVHAGDNIVLLNKFLEALNGDRQRTMALFLRAMTPYSFKNGQFTKKGDAKYVAEKLAAFNAFLDSGQSVFVWIGQNTKTETKEVDYKARFAKNAEKLLTEGHFSMDDCIELLQSVAASIAEKEAAKKAA